MAFVDTGEYFGSTLRAQPARNEAFAQIAEICCLGKTGVDAVRYWLANNEHDWLLIIDNADDPEFDYNCYIPAGTRGSIILTSRSPDGAYYGNTGSSEVVGLSSQDAVELSLTSCGLTEDMRPNNVMDGQSNDLRSIWRELCDQVGERFPIIVFLQGLRRVPMQTKIRPPLFVREVVKSALIIHLSLRESDSFE